MSDSQAGLILRSWRSSWIAYLRVSRPAREGASTRRPVLPRRIDAYLIFATGCVLIALCMIYVDKSVIDLTRPYYVVHEGSVKYLKQITKLGSSGWIMIISGAMALYFSATRWQNYERRERLRLVNRHADTTFVFFATFLTGSTVWILKNLIGRARPRMMDEVGHLYFDFAAFQAALASFPSGHATTFGCVGMAMSLLFPKHRVLWLCFGAFGAATRVLVGAHYPSDSIAGFIFGAGLTLLAARYLAQRGTMFRFNGGFVPHRIRFPSNGKR
ncbi:MAG: phosphatase PAP2 family protein [Rhizobiaceae bacterium]